MFSTVKSFGVTGVGGYEVSVEVYITGGFPRFELVGLPDAAVKEAKDRVYAAIKNNGFKFPTGRITINLAPADKKKAGTMYDLPILMGMLSAMGNIPRIAKESAFIGELSLTGELRPVQGALPMAIEAQRSGIKYFYVPEENASEAAFADEIQVFPVKNVHQLICHLLSRVRISYCNDCFYRFILFF